MPYIKVISNQMIERMQTLCMQAFESKEGLKIKTPSKSEALRLRQQIYAARRAIQKLHPGDTSPLSTIEMRLKEEILELLRPGALVSQFEIIDIATEKKIKLEYSEKDRKLANETLLSFSEDQIFEMCLKIATKKGAGNHEEEARAWLLAGNKVEDYK
jgi:hypothetical protein